MVDLRPVLEHGSSLVVRPWRDRSIENYLRGFGRICYRKNDIDAGVPLTWLRANESWYVSAGRFARVLPKDPRRAHAQLPGGWQVRQPIPARLFSDGVLSARLEIVLEANQATAGPALPSLTDVARLAVEMRHRQEGRRAPLRTQVELHDLKRHFRIAYARARQVSPDLGAQPRLELVQALDPLILILTRNGGSLQPVQGRWLSDVRGATASFRVLRLDAPRNGQSTVKALRRTFVRLFSLTGAMRQLSHRLAGPGDMILQNGAAEQLEPIVQQAHDGILALRERPNGSLAALEISVDGFRSEAEQFAKLLVQPDHKLLARRLLGFSNKWSNGKILIPGSLVDEIYALAIKLEIQNIRDAMLAGFPPEVVAFFDESSLPGVQLYHDILNLSRVAGPDDLPYIVPWLRNAEKLFSGKKAEADQLRSYAERATTCTEM